MIPTITRSTASRLIAVTGLIVAYNLLKYFLRYRNLKLREGFTIILLVSFKISYDNGVEFPIVEADKIRQQSIELLVNGKTYRVVYIAHKLGPSVPLLMFIHGLGAQLVQFEGQIIHFSQVANILAVDLLGHGKSEVSGITSFFDLNSLALDLVEIFDRYRLDKNVIISHSLGASLSALMYKKIDSFVNAMVLIGPRYSVPTYAFAFGYVPVIVWDLLRFFDQRNRLESKGLKEFLGENPSEEVKRKQFAINLCSLSLTLSRILRNANTLPTDNTWKLIGCPVQCLIGEYEKINRKEQTEAIEKLLPDSYTPIVIPNCGHNCHLENPGFVNAMISHYLVDDVKLKTLDASHQLLVMSKHSDKWSMKNYEKWKRTESVSKAVGNRSKIRGMKIMRDGDDVHSPVELLRKYPDIGLVIDISKDIPPYDTSKLNYLKISTQSKVPPSRNEVSRFIDELRCFWKSSDKNVAVHCHYGYNRTGFMICSYLIEVEKYRIQDALEAWKECRSPGIKHAHFKDELYLRYSQ